MSRRVPRRLQLAMPGLDLSDEVQVFAAALLVVVLALLTELLAASARARGVRVLDVAAELVRERRRRSS